MIFKRFLIYIFAPLNISLSEKENEGGGLVLQKQSIYFQQLNY